jgi:hypothetical protein
MKARGRFARHHLRRRDYLPTNRNFGSGYLRPHPTILGWELNRIRRWDPSRILGWEPNRFPCWELSTTRD